MDNRTEYIQALLKRFEAGRCTEEEIAELHEWLDEQAAGAQVSPFTGAEDRERIRTELEKRIFNRLEKRSTPLWRIAWYAAAAVLVFAIAGIGAYYYTRPARWEEHATGDGISLVTLQDGSRMWMNHYTRVKVREDFQHHRFIQLLQGEVFCDVRHDPDHPFHVSSGTYQVTDLGTAFSVSRYERWQGLKVSVVHGEVQVRDGERVLDTLYKGQRLRYTAGGQPILERDSISGDEATGWFGEGTVLHDLTLEEIAQWIEMHYGLKVVNHTSVLDSTRKYEVQMGKETSATDMVAILNLILKSSHTQLTLKNSIVEIAHH